MFSMLFMRGSTTTGSRQQAAGKATLLFIGLTMLLPGARLVAQQQTKDLGEASLEELANITVYTASRHVQKATEAPSSVTVVTRDEIQKYGYRTLADILRSVRGFDITYDRNFTYAGVRGINRPETYNSRVLLLIDGHRINNNIYEQAMLGTEFPLDVDLIERVEVVRGPSSSLYGTSAFFAVINVITRKPQQLSGWELSFEPASFGTFKGRASYGGKYQGMDMVLSGGFYDSQGQTLFYPEFNTPATDNGIARNADYDTYQHFLATVSLRGFTLQGVYSDRNKGIPTGAFGTLFNDSRSHTFDSERYLDLSYQRTMSRGWDLAARTSVGRHVYDGIYVYGPATPGESDLLNYDFARGTWWSSELKLQHSLERHNLTFGTEFQENLQQDQGNYNINPFLPYIASRSPRSGISAFYGQDEFALTRKLSLSAGVRYDHYYTFGGTTNPRLGLIYHPFSQTAFKLLYGSAFRAPSAYEMYYYGLGQYQANLHLQPEAIKSYEFVAEQELGKRFHLIANVFRNQVGQLITQGLNSSGFLVFQNTSGAHVTGFETELDGRFARGLQGKASYSYTDDQNALTRQTLTNSPKHLAKLNVIVPMLQRKLFAGLEAQFNGPSTTLAGNTTSSFQVFNATLLGQAMGKHLDISASVYNLLDKKYFDPAPVGLT
ncbi:MAG TPA: TonB-dependent receptor, partial [Terriglobales bacterium]|nr:TonB-dependent receptor [Terriglobales bacterium]